MLLILSDEVQIFGIQIDVKDESINLELVTNDEFIPKKFLIADQATNNSNGDGADDHILLA